MTQDTDIFLRWEALFLSLICAESSLSTNIQRTLRKRTYRSRSTPHFCNALSTSYNNLTSDMGFFPLLTQTLETRARSLRSTDIRTDQKMMSKNRKQKLGMSIIPQEKSTVKLKVEGLHETALQLQLSNQKCNQAHK